MFVIRERLYAHPVVISCFVSVLIIGFTLVLFSSYAIHTVVFWVVMVCGQCVGAIL